MVMNEGMKHFGLGQAEAVFQYGVQFRLDQRLEHVADDLVLQLDQLQLAWRAFGLHLESLEACLTPQLAVVVQTELGVDFGADIVAEHQLLVQTSGDVQVQLTVELNRHLVGTEHRPRWVVQTEVGFDVVVREAHLQFRYAEADAHQIVAGGAQEVGHFGRRFRRQLVVEHAGPIHVVEHRVDREVGENQMHHGSTSAGRVADPFRTERGRFG
ncbi:hypothetical protein T09_12644 [Trichinella sp. T9]|uniref:Uncharacterized protein n=1 Tax=Trichinella murrelli TaxID=144512 RepID=A0A0V0TKR9_9BILA|nr:hypothetical protein T05_5973 [Trichinella murrelli]KRX58647.1 hypothetical protein T09_12644 [Trichinella sp. T9]